MVEHLDNESIATSGLTIGQTIIMRISSIIFECGLELNPIIQNQLITCELHSVIYFNLTKSQCWIYNKKKVKYCYKSSHIFVMLGEFYAFIKLKIDGFI